MEKKKILNFVSISIRAFLNSAILDFHALVLLLLLLLTGWVPW